MRRKGNPSPEDTMMEETHQRLEEMHRQICFCTACPLHQSRTHAVPGEGDPAASLMLIGEAPGAREDETGRPFCGRSGDFLDQLLAEIDYDRRDAYISSTVKCRPPGNRDPRAAEMDTCQELWLNQQLRLVDPNVVLLLGKIATGQILGEKGTLRQLHGQVRELGGRRWIPTYHPAAGMRFPEPEKGIRADFQLVRDLLHQR